MQHIVVSKQTHYIIVPIVSNSSPVPGPSHHASVFSLYMQAASANYRAIGALSQQISALRELVIGAQADNRIFKQGNYQHPGSVAKDSGEHSCEHRRTRNPHSDTSSNDSGEVFSNSSLSGSPSFLWGLLCPVGRR